MNPFEVVCPECHAAVGAKCTERKLDGKSAVGWMHFARIDKAKDGDTSTPPLREDEFLLRGGR